MCWSGGWHANCAAVNPWDCTTHCLCPPLLPMSLPLQASSRGYDRLPQFGAAGRHGLARGEQERLLMKLRVVGLLQDDTQRQEQHGSIVSVLSLHQVGSVGGRL